MEITYFRRLFRYDQWANEKAFAALQAAKMRPAQSLRWLAHLAGAGHTWLGRVRKETPLLPIWPELPIEQCESYLETLGEGWLTYLDSLTPAGLSESMIYRNSRGEEFATTVSDVLTQVLTHGAYHRGQIAAEMRACGETPASTDFIIAERENALRG